MAVRLVAMRALLEPLGFTPRRDERSRQYVFARPWADRRGVETLVYSSIMLGRAEANGVGEDSIRVAIVDTGRGRAVAGRGAWVCRTRMWRTALQERIRTQEEKARGQT